METTGFGVILLGLEGSRPCRIPEDTTRLASRYWPLEKKKKKTQHLKKSAGRRVLGSKQRKRNVVSGQVNPRWFLPECHLDDVIPRPAVGSEGCSSQVGEPGLCLCLSARPQPTGKDEQVRTATHGARCCQASEREPHPGGGPPSLGVDTEKELEGLAPEFMIHLARLLGFKQTCAPVHSTFSFSGETQRASSG